MRVFTVSHRQETSRMLCNQPVGKFVIFCRRGNEECKNTSRKVGGWQ